MAQYMQFPTMDGGTILVEVDMEERETNELVKAGLGEKVRDRVVQVRDSFEATMMETVRRNAEAFVLTMRDLTAPPAKAEISFGLNATAELGYSAVGKAGGQSTYTVTLTWKHEKASENNG